MSSFKDVVGHKNIIQYIENAVKTDKVSHAYILNGEKRFRKTTSGKFVRYEPAVSEPG